MNRVERYEFIIDVAKSDDEVKTCREFVTFHNFNVNGVYRQLRAVEDEGWELAQEEKIPYGVMYGTLNFKYDYKELETLLNQKNPHWNKAGSRIRNAEESLKNAKERLNELLNKDSI